MKRQSPVYPTLRSIVLLCFLSTIIFLLTCTTGTTNSSDQYAFFVAGHVYGSPNGDEPGLHPPFLNKFESINKDTIIRFGVFTGDIVRSGTNEAWDSVDSQLKRLNIPVHFCPGNHDTYNRELYESRYGKPYFYFIHHDDVFITLDGNINNWNIVGKQLKFLNQVLDENSNARNIFIFIHQLVWWKKQTVFEQVNLNWPPYTPDSTNYWSTIEPILKSQRGNVYLFAGDLGANDQASSIAYYQDNNIFYIASGMGDNKRDNFIKVTVSKDKKVDFEIIALQGKTNRLGRLEDHSI